MSNGYKKKALYITHYTTYSGRFLNRNLPLKSLRLLLHIKIFAYVDFNLKKFSFHLKRVQFLFPFSIKIIFSLIFKSIPFQVFQVLGLFFFFKIKEFIEVN